MAKSITAIKTIQPISASHSRCQASHTRPSKGRPDVKPVANEGEPVGRSNDRVSRVTGA